MRLDRRRFRATTKAAAVPLAALLVWGVAAGILSERAWGRALDDFFITFRYAANLASGNGLAFNPGELAFGTTAPGFAVLLAALHLLTRVSIDGLGTLLTAVAIVGLALVVLVELRAQRRIAEGIVAGCLLVTSPYLWPQHGSEIPIALLFLCLAARSARTHPHLSAVTAAVAAWCRPEFAVGALAIALLVDGNQVASLRRYLTTLVGSGLVFTLFDRITMGSFIPITLEAKRAQADWLPGTFSSGLAFWSHSLQTINYLGFGALTSLALGLGIAGLPVLWRSAEDGCRILIVQCLVLAVAYPILGVADYPWYAIPLVILLTVSATVTGGALVRHVAASGGDPHSRWARARGSLTLAGLLLPLALVWPPRVADMYQHLRPNQHYDLYKRTGEWFAENTEAGASIAYVEVGTIGYFSRRRVHDLLGLVSPAALPYVSLGDMPGAFLAAPTDYFIFDRNLFGFLDPVLQQEWFRASYRRVAHLDALPGGAERVVIYRRLPGASLPPPRPPRPPDIPAVPTSNGT